MLDYERIFWYTRHMRTIQTTYRYRLEPTDAQAAHLRRFAGTRRWVWNWALQRKKDHYATTKQRLSLAMLYTELKDLKQQPQTAWLPAMDSQALQQVLQDLDKAFQAFFAKRSGFSLGNVTDGFDKTLRHRCSSRRPRPTDPRSPERALV
jgi:transposase